MRPGVLLFVVLLGAGPAAAAIRMPVQFEANRGQAPPEVGFVARAPGFVAWLSATGARLHGEDGRALALTLAGARREAPIAGEDAQAARIHYFHGSDPARWLTGVETYGRVVAREVYPGIDLVYHARQGTLEFDFVVAPGADPSRIALSFAGASGLGFGPAGEIGLDLEEGIVTLHPPAVYQEACGGRRLPVEGSFRMASGGAVGFALGAHLLAAPLVIDPTLVYSSYLGGSAIESASSVALDASGVYLAGTTNSINFPATGSSPIQPSRAGAADFFVAKLDPTGATLLWATYMGGGVDEYSPKIAVDDTGAVYLTGTTLSSDYPAVKAFQAFAGGSDIVATKIDPAGSALVFSTFLGGTLPDDAGGIGVDLSHAVYLAGYTLSDDFPLVGALQPMRMGSHDVVLARIEPVDPPVLGFSSYFGGNGEDTAAGLAVSPSGLMHVTFWTTSNNLPVRNAAQATWAGAADGFVLVLAPGGISPVRFATYLGGTLDDYPTDVAAGPLGETWVCGYTATPETDPRPFPTTPGAFDVLHQPPFEAFVTSFAPAGSIAASTLLGEIGDDQAWAVGPDASGGVWVAGHTESPSFPLMTPFQSQISIAPDIFVSRLTADLTGLTFSSYLGGDDTDTPGGLAVDAQGAAWVAGYTASSDYPVRMPYAASLRGTGDACVSKIGDSGCTSAPGRVANTLYAAKTPPAPLTTFRVTWTDIGSVATSYALYQDAVKSGPFATPSGTATSGFTGVAKTITPEPILHYRVAAVNACGEGPKE